MSKQEMEDDFYFVDKEYLQKKKKKSTASITTIKQHKFSLSSRKGRMSVFPLHIQYNNVLASIS